MRFGSQDVAQFIGVLRVFLKDLGVQLEVEEVVPVDLVRKVAIGTGRPVRELIQEVRVFLQ